MPRHRGKYNPANPEPYELSRSKIEAFIKCPACFWIEKAAGIKFPSMPGFLLNTNTDTLLKKDFDQYRGKGPHPLMVQSGLGHLRPFAYEYMDKWVQSTQFGASPNHFNTVHQASNILFGGGLDDVWENIETGELHVVDYKSTAQMGANPKPLDESFIAPPADNKTPDYKAGYRRQMDMYQWILRQRGYQVSDTGYFVYVDGLHNGIDGMLDATDPSQANMRFKVAVIPYHGSDAWVEEVLSQAKACLELTNCPEHDQSCEYGAFISAIDGVSKGNG